MRSVALCFVAIVSPRVSACDDTARGIGETQQEAEEHIQASTSEAQAKVSQEMAEFRRESQAKLRAMDEKLIAPRTLARKRQRRSQGGSAGRAERASGRARRPRQKAATEAHAKTKAEWNETERQFDQSLAQLGKDINHALDDAGDKTEKALE